MSSRRETFELAAGTPRLEARLSKADLHIVASEDEHALVVELTGSNPDEVRVEQCGSTVSVIEESSRRFRSPVGSVTVWLPAGGIVDVALGVGDLTVDATLEGLRVRTASGDVRVVEVTDRCEAKTASGDLRIEHIGNSADITTASGNVRIGSVGGDCTCTSAAGDVTVTEADGTLTARTAAGDIHVSRFSGRELKTKSMSGDVEVHVVPGRRVRYDFDSLSGKLRTRGGQEPSETPEEERLPVDIRVKTLTGDLTLGVTED